MQFANLEPIHDGDDAAANSRSSSSSVASVVSSAKTVKATNRNVTFCHKTKMEPASLVNESQIDIINAVWYNISPGQRTVLLNYLSTLQFRQTHMVDEGIEYQFTDLMSALENDLHRNNALTTEDYTNVSRLLVLIPTLSHAAIAQISRDLNQRHRVAFVVHQTSIQADGNELHEISSTAASVGGSIQTFGTV